MQISESLSPFSHSSIFFRTLPQIFQLLQFYQTYISASSTQKAYCFYLSAPSFHLSSTVIWKQPPGRKLRWLSQDSLHTFPFSLFSQSSAVCCSVSEHVCFTYIFHVFSCLWQQGKMILVILSWLKVGINNTLLCIFNPAIKLNIWVCLHSSVIRLKLD